MRNTSDMKNIILKQNNAYFRKTLFHIFIKISPKNFKGTPIKPKLPRFSHGNIITDNSFC